MELNESINGVLFKVDQIQKVFAHIFTAVGFLYSFLAALFSRLASLGFSMTKKNNKGR